MDTTAVTADNLHSAITQRILEWATASDRQPEHVRIRNLTVTEGQIQILEIAYPEWATANV